MRFHVTTPGLAEPPPVVVLTDRCQAREAAHSLPEVAAAAAEAGAAAVLLREKDLPPAERRRLARTLRDVTAHAGVGLIVASDVELALEVGADGVHLAGADPWPGEETRARLDHLDDGGRVMVGRSCHSIDELATAGGRFVDYATLSPVFATSSKPGYGPALGLEGLAAGCRAVPDLPIVALGGIRPGRAAGCVAAGARGVAVMGAVMRADDPGEVVRRLAAELRATTVAPVAEVRRG